jgi:charged multivesicular body protein 4A/B
MDTANEISEAIGRPVDGDTYDEDELLGELNMLEEEDLEDQLLTPAVAAPAPKLNLPDAPIGGLESKEAEDEDERALRELEASLAM